MLFSKNNLKGLWKLDLHLHTTASDGILTPDELCHLLRLLDIKAIVTDHDTVMGQAKLMELCPDRTVRGVYAMEKTERAHMLWHGKAYQVHFNVYCPWSFTASEVPDELSEAYRWAEEHGCIIQWNHPLFWPNQVPWLSLGSWLRYGAEHSHMVELSNGNQMFWQDWLAYYGLGGKPFLPGRYWKALQGFAPPGKIATSNTDMHLPQALGLNYNLSPPLESFDDFARAVKNREIKAGRTKRAPICIRATELRRWSAAVSATLRAIMSPIWKACGVNEGFVAFWSLRDEEYRRLVEKAVLSP